MPTAPGATRTALTYAAARLTDRVAGTDLAALMTARFGPGLPITPPLVVADPEPEPRQWQYPVGYNTNFGKPRSEQGGLAPFDQLRALASSYDVASLCIATITNLISSLDLQIVAKDKKAQAAENPTCDAMLTWFAKPDRVNDLSSWLTMVIYEMLVTDALTIYPRPDKGGGLWGLEAVDGTTIKPLLDTRGQTAAYQQILYGTPWGNYERPGTPDDDDFPVFSSQELFYRPRWTRVTTPYGFPPTERIIMRVNMALRKQVQDLGRFTDGNIPVGILSPPEGLMTPEQVALFEDWWNAKLAGDNTALQRIHFLPWKAAYQELQKQSEGGRYESGLDDAMFRITCAAFDMPPQELGDTLDVNKATGGIQENALYRRCIIPTCTWLLRTIFNPILQGADYLNQPQLEARFDYGESEDIALVAKTQQDDVVAGILGATESRAMRYPDLEGPAPGPPTAGLLPGSSAVAAPATPTVAAPTVTPTAVAAVAKENTMTRQPLRVVEHGGYTIKGNATITEAYTHAQEYGEVSKSWLHMMCERNWAYVTEAGDAYLNDVRFEKIVKTAEHADGPPDDPERRQWERKLLVALNRAYGAQADRIKQALRDVQDVTAGALDATFASETAAILRDVLPIYDDVAAAAAQAGLDQLTIGVDWSQVNAAVLQLAQERASAFAADSTKTSQAQVSQVIANWIATGGTLDDLISRVERVWSGPRADVAAITEVTRLYAEGNQAAWVASGVVSGYTWQTSNDEAVCPQCGPLQGQAFDAGDTSNLPPAHPRCRCWVTPVVKKASEL